MSVDERWVLRRGASNEFLLQVSELDPILAKVLYARKIDTREQVDLFLSGLAPAGDPMDLPDMGLAVERIWRAIGEQESIVVYGDFDADGVSATAVLVSALRELGAQARAFIPDRFDEGYGLSVAAIESIAAEGCDLVLTVDCGVRSAAEVAHANALGLEMVITDHHSVPEKLPPALAVVNPRRADSRYGFESLAGVGVAYRLVEALAAARPQGAALIDPTDWLDIVALGTVADIVPLEGENRMLVRQGLERLRQSPRVGIAALMDVAGVTPSEVNGTDIGFRLGPRINAAGRMRHADLAYRLLITRDAGEARHLAAELDQVNDERRSVLDSQTRCALEALGVGDGGPALIVSGADYHEGIVGLIASRLRETFYRPALVMRADEGLARGSARSIEGFHITEALEDCEDLLVRFGGHAQAAGFTLSEEKLGAFVERFQGICAERISEADLQRIRRVDAIVALSELSIDTPGAIAAMEPFGEGNPEPALATRALRIQSMRTVGSEGRHLKMQVSGNGAMVDCIAFRLGHLVSEYRPGDQVDLVYRPTVNEWRGERSLQLMVSAVRPAQ